jgi:hypothetical protein
LIAALIGAPRAVVAPPMPVAAPARALVSSVPAVPSPGTPGEG